MLTGRKGCDHPHCYNKATGRLKMQSLDSLFGKTRIEMHLCSKHYNDMLEFISAYIGIKKEGK